MSSSSSLLLRAIPVTPGEASMVALWISVSKSRSSPSQTEARELSPDLQFDRHGSGSTGAMRNARNVRLLRGAQGSRRTHARPDPLPEQPVQRPTVEVERRIERRIMASRAADEPSRAVEHVRQRDRTARCAMAERTTRGYPCSRRVDDQRTPTGASQDHGIRRRGDALNVHGLGPTDRVLAPEAAAIHVIAM